MANNSAWKKFITQKAEEEIAKKMQLAQTVVAQKATQKAKAVVSPGNKAQSASVSGVSSPAKKVGIATKATETLGSKIGSVPDIKQMRGARNSYQDAASALFGGTASPSELKEKYTQMSVDAEKNALTLADQTMRNYGINGYSFTSMKDIDRAAQRLMTSRDANSIKAGQELLAVYNTGLDSYQLNAANAAAYNAAITRQNALDKPNAETEQILQGSALTQYNPNLVSSIIDKDNDANAGVTGIYSQNKDLFDIYDLVNQIGVFGDGDFVGPLPNEFRQIRDLQMTEDQRYVFNHYINSGEYGKARAYLADVRMGADVRWTENVAMPTYEAYALNSPVRAYMSAIGNTLKTAAQAPLQQIAARNGGNTTVYSPIYQDNLWASTINQTQGEYIKDKAGFLPYVAYNAATSGINNLLASIPSIITGTPFFSMAIMGSEAASSDLYSQLQLGVEPEKAANHALVTAFVEFATERMGIDALMKDPRGNILKYLLNTGAAEGLEEGVSGAVSPIVDAMFDEFNSPYWQDVVSRVYNGETLDEAKMGATGSTFADIGEGVLTGFLAGAGQGTAGLTIPNSVRSIRMEGAQTLLERNREIQSEIKQLEQKVEQGNMPDAEAENAKATIAALETEKKRNNEKVETLVKKMTGETDEKPSTQQGSVSNPKLEKGISIKNMDKDGNFTLSDGSTRAYADVDMESMPQTEELASAALRASEDYGVSPGVYYGAYQDGKNVSQYNYAASAIMSAGYAGGSLDTVMARQNVADVVPMEMAKALYVAAANKGKQDISANRLNAKLASPLPTDGTVTLTEEARAELANDASNSPRVKIIEAMTDMANAGVFKKSGLKIEFYASKADADGKYTAEQGSYAASTNTIRVDVNAGRSSVTDTAHSAVGQVVSHELTHFIRANSDTQYKALQSYVADALAKRGESLDAHVQQIMADYKSGGKNLRLPDAMEEAVAQACEMALRDSQFASNLVKSNRTLAEKIRDFLKDLSDKIKAAFAGARHITDMSKAMEQDMEGLVEIWDRALVETLNLHEAFEQMEDTPAEQTEASETDALHIDMRTMENVGDTAVSSFMNEHRKSRPFFTAAANFVAEDAYASVSGERFMDEDGNWSGQKRITTDALASLKDNYGYTWQQIKDTLSRIANMFDSVDQEAEMPNTALFKRVELILDEALSSGYATLSGLAIAPDAAWLEYKRSLPGADTTQSIPENAVEFSFLDAYDGGDEGVRYSIRTTEDGTKYVLVDTDQSRFDGLSPNDMIREARNVILEKFRGRVIGESENKAYVNSRGAGEYTHPAKRVMGETLAAKMRASTELDNLLKASTFLRHDSKSHHKEATGGFDIYKTIFYVAGTVYTGDVQIMNTEKGRLFYDVTHIKESTDKTVKAIKWDVSHAAAVIGATGDSIAYEEPSVNPKAEEKHSIRTEQTETDAFKRWFKDSKVVNADGTPKVMYHGSPAAFTAFDRKKAKSSGMYGRGFYFTNSDTHAGQYGNLYSVYLSVQNPLTPDGSKVSMAQIRRFLEAVAENEDYSIENYGTYDTNAILRKITSRDAFTVLQDINSTAIGDFVEAVQLFNQVNGTNFDGIIVPTETVVFEPTQIKSATDNTGAFDPSNPDIRYSLRVTPEQDAEYMNAVQNDDMETVQRMVDQAAKNWGAFLNNSEANEVFKQSGEVRKFYHGTNTGDFTVFNKSLLGNSSGDLGWFGKGFYFAFSQEEAASYGERVISAYLKMKNPYDYSQLYSFKGSERGASQYSRFAWIYNIVKQFPEIVENQKVYYYPDGAEDGTAISWKQLADMMDRIEQEAKFSVEQVELHNGRLAWELRADPKQESFTNDEGETFTWTEYGMEQTFATEADAKNPINQIGAYLENVMGVQPVPRRAIERIEFSNAVQKAGYDGIIQSPSGDEAVVFDSSQIKSSEPVEYDDDGNVIPLSERFNPENEDIRFSMRGEAPLTDREILGEALNEVAVTNAERLYLGRYKKVYGNWYTETHKLKKNRDAAKIANLEAQLRKMETDPAFATLVEAEKTRAEEAVQRDFESGHTYEQDRADLIRGYEARLREKQRNLSKYRAERNESATRQKYLSRVEREANALSELLTTNTDKKHVPEALKAPLGEFLASLNRMSKRKSEGGEATKKDLKLNEQLRRVQEVLRKQSLGAENVSVEGNLYLPDSVVDMVGDIIETMENYTRNNPDMDPVYSMDNKRLKNLSDVLTILRKAINNVNRTFANAQYAKIDTLGDNTYNYLTSMRRASDRNNKLTDHLNWEMLTPIYAFEKLGEAGQSIFKGLMDGYGRFSRRMNEIESFSSEHWNAKKVKDWGESVVERTFERVDDDGNEYTATIRMTQAQIMSLYLLSKREQAVKHIEGGGIKAATVRKGAKDLIYQSEAVMLSMDEVHQLTSTLTAEQLKICHAIADFFKRTSDWGNEVSMERFGYKAFGELNYFPIVTDDTSRKAIDDKGKGGTDLYRLLNMSFTKALAEKTDNALVVDNIFTVFADHASDMAKYSTMALPVLDAIRWYNYGWKSKGDNQKSVRSAMRHAYKDAAEKYVQTFISDLSGVTRSSKRTHVGLDTLMRNAKIASVAANFNVIAQQGTSILRAMYAMPSMATHPWRTFTPKTLAGFRSNYAEMLDHSGIALWKSMGYYDTNVGRPLEQRIAKGEGVVDKLVDIASWGAETVDKLTFTTIWNAAKADVKGRKNGPKKGTQEYWAAVTDLFENVIYKTQVVDGVMNRSHQMRSTDSFDKIITSFMAEPVLSYNVAHAALSDAYRNKRIHGHVGWKNTWKILGTTATVMSANVVAGIIKSFFSALRDEDDYATFAEKLEEQLLGDGDTWYEKLLSSGLADAMNPFGWIPIINNAVDMFKGEESTMAGSAINYIQKAWKEIQKLYEGSSTANPVKTGTYIVRAFSYVSGLPFYSLGRDLIAVWNSTIGTSNPNLKLRTYGSTASEGYEAYYDAILAGDTAEMKRLEKVMKINKTQSGKTHYENLSDNLAKIVKEEYLSGALPYDKAEEILIKYCGRTETGTESAYHDITAWEYKAATGATSYSMYIPLRSALLAGDKQGIEDAYEDLVTHYGKKEKEIDSQVPSIIRDAMEDGEIDRQTAERLMREYTDKTSTEIRKYLDRETK